MDISISFGIFLSLVSLILGLFINYNTYTGPKYEYNLELCDKQVAHINYRLIYFIEDIVYKAIKNREVRSPYAAIQLEHNKPIVEKLTDNYFRNLDNKELYYLSLWKEKGKELVGKQVIFDRFIKHPTGRVRFLLFDNFDIIVLYTVYTI